MRSPFVALVHNTSDSVTFKSPFPTRAEYNIEADVLITNAVAAKVIVAQFESLVVQKILLRVPRF